MTIFFMRVIEPSDNFDFFRAKKITLGRLLKIVFLTIVV